MRPDLAKNLAQALKDLLGRPMGPEEMRAYERWRNPELQNAGSPPQVSLPISRVMTDQHVVVHDGTLIVFFKWPLEPDRQFAYIEELGDLTPMDPTIWSAILLDHIDEELSVDFSESSISLANVSFVGPDISAPKPATTR
jgi:hypothetical protein